MLRFLRFDPSEREGLENLISLTFVLLMFVYVVFFLGDLYLVIKRKLHSHFPELSYLELLIKYGVIIVVPVVYTRAFIFGHDALAHGRDRYAEFFRQTLPSRLLRDRFSCAQGKADELWFKIFNVWGVPNHPRHPQWVTTFRRTYMCRFIYLVRRSLFRASAIFAITLAADEWYTWWLHGPLAVVDEDWFLKTGITVLTLSVAILLSVRNRIGSHPTGCWARLVEIEDAHKAWLEQEITKASAGNFDKAWELASVMERQWKQPPQAAT